MHKVDGYDIMYFGCKPGRRVGMADEADSKSVVGNHVRVQVPPPAVQETLRVLIRKVFSHL